MGSTIRLDSGWIMIVSPKITIVGLLPRQANTIRSLYGADLDLKFIEVDTSTAKMKATAESSDQVVLMTKFIPHEVQTALREHDLIYCNGGVSSLKALLDAMPRL